MNSDNLSISFASSLGITDFAADIPENFNTDQPDKSINLNYKQESYKRKASSPKQTDKDPIQSFLNESKWHNHSQRPLNSRNLMKDPINNRARSPGEHFGKRSMPLDNMSAMWSKETGNRKPSHSKEENVSEANNKKDTINNLLEARFKTLPASFKKTYDIANEKRHTKSAAKPPFHSSPHTPCIIEPTRIHFECEVKQNMIYSKVTQLKLRNTSSESIRTFSLFSSNGMLEFEMNEGAVLEEEEIEIKVRIKSESIQQLQTEHASDKLLVLIDQANPTMIDVSIKLSKDQPNSSPPQRPECPFCALEKGYPLHCLQK
ncbi:hypothetical protein G6F46_008706 [Rhizopus delemar]|uniref:MSP domain-containing protein n=2 Tax=Rhizopus TaxID=4842 RepID=A0A9P6YZ45_9FUNG|nr:hypothetical protein G6F55_007649 [Rhizopus delemar]KAG1552233.1 hypothetical protein G6F51_001354 [Rhizopus arrhizus]KAG1493944.1 hypothetical protein G6F54_008224 [Rhizopus delemar]KAG1514440.1 hypothetical protein G6F53_003670 [Rhizopus delemar]KAG1523482.1 hypothetical protein G6F52_004985 [Rhizopus delemar]